MFFRRKNRDDISADAGEKGARVKGTSPDLVEAPAPADEAPADQMAMAASEETVGGGVVAPVGASLPAQDDDAIRLFPGFERDDFEVGFRQDRDAPALMVRWKDGGEWFVVPALFNRGILAAMDERESSSDLNRLLRNYGYDVEPSNG